MSFIKKIDPRTGAADRPSVEMLQHSQLPSEALQCVSVQLKSENGVRYDLDFIPHYAIGPVALLSSVDKNAKDFETTRDRIATIIRGKPGPIYQRKDPVSMKREDIAAIIEIRRPKLSYYQIGSDIKRLGLHFKEVEVAKAQSDPSILRKKLLFPRPRTKLG